MFGWGKKKREAETGLRGRETLMVDFGPGRMPTVKFDPARVTETVKADLIQNVISIAEIGPNNFDAVYDAALVALSAGGNLPPLYQALIAIEGMSKKRAMEITYSLSSKSHALMTVEQFERVGMKQAIWRYSGAPCEVNPKKPTATELRQNEAHKNADGKIFDVAEGMFLNGKWTLPGYEDGCKCVARSVIPGFS